MSSPNERPRIRELRLDLANRLSKLAPDPALLEDLQKQPLERLMVLYVHAAIRCVAPRPRKIIVKQPDDPHWRKIAPKAASLLKLAEEGGDMMPYICLSPHLRDFAIPGAGYAEWHDKDLLLAAMGYHVFQCEPRDQTRTGNHVLAFVDRLTFTVIGAFQGNAVNSDGPERTRLWDQVRAHGVAPVNRQSLINLGIDRARKIDEIDPKLDDPDFVRQLYVETQTPMPGAVNWRWHLPFMDFGFLETNAPRFFMIWPGPN
jgi:hypothetical protein